MNNLQSWGFSYNPKEYEATVENFAPPIPITSPPIPWPPSFPAPSGTFPDGDTCKDKYCGDVTAAVSVRNNMKDVVATDTTGQIVGACTISDNNGCPSQTCTDSLLNAPYGNAMTAVPLQIFKTLCTGINDQSDCTATYNGCYDPSCDTAPPQPTTPSIPISGAPIPWPPSFPAPSGTFPDGGTCKDKFCAHNPATGVEINVVNNMKDILATTPGGNLVLGSCTVTDEYGQESEACTNKILATSVPRGQIEIQSFYNICKDFNAKYPCCKSTYNGCAVAPSGCASAPVP